MEQFKCYGYYKDDDKCYTQCTVCERKELLEKSDVGSIPKERTGIPFPSQQRAKEQRDKLYTRMELFEFAGFCMGRKLTNPSMSVEDILNEFNATFGHG